MKKVFTGVCVGGLLICGTAIADTFYLHADMPINSSPNDKTLWWTDPVAGSVMSAGDVFAGNRFDVQEFDWRAPNTTATTTFDGTLVVASSNAKLCLQYAADWHLAGMDIDGYALIRPHRPSVSMSVADLLLGTSGTLTFRTLTGNNIQNLSVANLAGSGTIQFGTSYANDTNALWNLSVSDTTPEFNGAVVLLRGELTFGNAFALDEARLLIVEAENNRMVLANAVSFGTVEFGAGTLAAGTYTAAELNTLLGTDRFSGSGTLSAGSSDYYLQWVESYPALGSSTNKTDDPDADGMNNLAEYSLGGNPMVPDAETILPSADLGETSGTNWLNYAYTRRRDAERRGLSYSVLSGTDLLGTIGKPTEEVGVAAVDTEFETVTNRMPTIPDAQGFMQLKVSTAAGAGLHPRLFFYESDLPAIRQKVQNGWLKTAFDKMKANADVYMTVPTNPYPISGSGNGTATAGRAINERVNTLALTGMILDDSSYITKAIDICMSAIAQTDVNDFDSYNGALAVGDAMHAYAVAYDWLYNNMTEAQRTSLRDEIMEFGSWMYNYSVYGGYYYGSTEPTPLSSNHNAVSHGALGLAALSTSSHPEWRELARRQINGYFQYARDATGWNYEGIGYFGYGSLNAQTFSVAFRREAHGDLVAAQPKNFSIPEWILRFVQPWGSSFVALNDSPERLGISGGLMQLLSQNQDGVGLWTWLKMFGPDGDGTYGSPVGGYIGDGCTIPYIILFADAALQPVSPADAGLPLGKFFARGGGSFRSSWDDNAALATFTCGFDQHRGHNHRDENSFTLSAFGEYFAIDPGYMPNMTRAHNTILVDGLGQDHEPDEYDVYGEILDTQDFGVAWYMKGEAAEAYTNSIGIDHAIRQFLFAQAPQPYIVIADDIQKTSGTADYTWLLHTRTTNQIEVDSVGKEFLLRGPSTGSAVCQIKFLNPQTGLTVEESDLTGETFDRWGETRNFSSYFKEIRASYTGTNPGFVAILIAAESTGDLPTVTTTQDSNGLMVNIIFSDGMQDHVLITSGSMAFSRDPAP